MWSLTLSYSALVLVTFGTLSCLALTEEDIKLISDTDKHVATKFSNTWTLIDLTPRVIMETAIKFINEHPNAGSPEISGALKQLVDMGTQDTICLNGNLINDLYNIYLEVPIRDGLLVKAIFTRFKDYKNWCHDFWQNRIPSIQETLKPRVGQYLDFIRPLAKECEGKNGFQCLMEEKADAEQMGAMTLKALKRIAVVLKDQTLMYVMNDPTGDVATISHFLTNYIGSDCSQVVGHYKGTMLAAVQTAYLLKEFDSSLGDAFWEKAAALLYCNKINKNTMRISKEMLILIQENQ